MATRTSPEIEERIRAAWQRGDHASATTVALESYGPEILGFLGALLGDVADADDVFSTFCEDIWRGFAGFEWRCTARCWCFTLARNAAMRFHRSHGERSGQVPLSQAPEVKLIADRVRSATTEAHRKSEVKSELRRLREQLSPDEQTLLILRIDKDLPWDEVARVLAGGDTPGDLARATARVRKRFQLVKDKLRKMVRESGLL